MRGVSKWINTKEDILNNMEVDKKATKKKLQEMLDGRFSWIPVKPLEEKNDGIEDETHKVVTMQAMDGGDEEEHWQYELREDPNAWMFRIGLTVDIINEYLGA